MNTILSIALALALLTITSKVVTRVQKKRAINQIVKQINGEK